MHEDPIEERPTPAQGDPPRSVEAIWRPEPFRGFPPELEPPAYLTSAVQVGGHYFSILAL